MSTWKHTLEAHHKNISNIPLSSGTVLADFRTILPTRVRNLSDCVKSRRPLAGADPPTTFAAWAVDREAPLSVVSWAAKIQNETPTESTNTPKSVRST